MSAENLLHPLFTIIVPDYEGAVSEVRREACITALQRSWWRDFEVLWFHDGPASTTWQQRMAVLAQSDARFHIEITPQRHNDWGHSLRQLGIDRARGRYLLHLNADNVLYPQALACLQAYSQRQFQTISAKRKSGAIVTHCINPEVMIFAIRLMGCLNAFIEPGHVRNPGKEATQQLILPGWPPRPFMIDAMQLVATQEIWREMGGWHDRTETSDGRLYAAISKRYGYLVVPEILGEHW